MTENKKRYFLALLACLAVASFVFLYIGPLLNLDARGVEFTDCGWNGECPDHSNRQLTWISTILSGITIFAFLMPKFKYRLLLRTISLLFFSLCILRIILIIISI